MLKTIFSLIDAGIPLKTPGNSNFLTPKAKLAFLRLRQAFTEVLIFHHFNLECYICIKTVGSGYAIGGILSQQTPKLGQ